MSARGDEDLDLVVAAKSGDESAFGALFDRWFDRVFDVSYRILHDRDLAAETAQDVFLVAWQQLGDLRQPGSFGGWLLRMSRNRSLNRLERERRSVALGDEETGAVIDARSPTPDASAQVDDAEQTDLVWAAAAALGERDASVLDLHLRHGFGAPEIAEALDITANNAHQLLFRLKDRLGSAIRGWVLWHHGRPGCDVLAGVLSAAGITDFGSDAVRAISRHAKGCEDCESRQATRLSPEAMFAAVPIAVAGPFLKQRAAAALTGEGVPMSGSEAMSPSVSSAPGRSRRGPRSRRGAYALMAAAAVVLVLAAVTALAESLDDGTGEVAGPTTTTEEIDPTTTSLAPSTTTEVTEPTEVSTPETSPPTDPSRPPAALPPVVATPTDPTTGTTGSSTTTPPAAPPPPPRVTVFEATLLGLGGGGCQTFEEGVMLVWDTQDGSTVRIDWLEGRTRQALTGLPVDGAANECLVPGAAAPVYTLTVANRAGESATQSVIPTR